MSYILDALKRAEAERERGTVPHLHAQLLADVAHARNLHAPVWGGWPWAVLFLLLALAAYGGWRYWLTPALVVAASERPALSNEVMTAKPAPSNSAVGEAPKPAVSTELQPLLLPRRDTVARVQIGETPARPVSPQVGGTPASVAAQPVARPIERTVRTEVEQVSEPKGAASVPTNVTPVVAAIKWGELPDAIRQQIPPLNISGVVYSESGHEKILLVNDKLVTRGSFAAPEVRLEEVGENSATFSYRGKLFRLDL